MVKKTDGKSCCCLGKRCEVCIFLKEKIIFTNKDGSDTYKKREDLYLHFNSEYVIYLISLKYATKKQYVGSCISSCFYNYRNCHKEFCNNHSVVQVSFYAQFMLNGQCGIDDWEIISIDKGRNNFLLSKVTPEV